VYGRLAADNEILAIKAAGINILHVTWPAILLGILTSATTVYLYLDIIPETHHMLRTKFIQDVEELLYGMLRRDGVIRHPKLQYEIFVKTVKGRKLIDAQFRHRDPKTGHYDIIACSKEAELLADLAHKQILVEMHKCHIATDADDTSYVEARIWPVDLPPEIMGEQTTKLRPTDMTWSELFDNRARAFDQIAKNEEKIADHLVQINLNKAPSNFPQHVQDLKQINRATRMFISQVDAEFQMRPALALGCLCFVLVGCPVGIWFSRSDYLSAFITCFLPIVVVYYPLLLCGINLGKVGKIEPIVAIWSANALMAVIAIFLFRRLLKN
jgi:lipopolysaccharide export system permease protein